jgi:hypothetical protein
MGVQKGFVFVRQKIQRFRKGAKTTRETAELEATGYTVRP